MKKKVAKPKPQKQKKFITFTWNRMKPISGAEVLINGKLVVFIACSLISSFINLVFITNLTKSDYAIGTLLSIPAAVLLGFMSIGLDMGKALLAIQVNTLNEFIRKLTKYNCVKHIKRVSYWWKGVYATFILLSIITSVSLSSISIGAGISRNANLLKIIDEQIVKGETYVGLDSTSKNIQMKSLVNKATDNSEQNAISFVETQTSLVWPKIQEWQDEYTKFLADGKNPNSHEKLEKKYNGYDTYWDYWTKRDNEINALLSSSKYSTGKLSEYQINRLTLAQFEKSVKANYLKTYTQVSNAEAEKKLEELTQSSNREALGWIEILNNLQLEKQKVGGKENEKEIVKFDMSPDKDTKVLVQSALTQLKALRVEVENDSGDIGSSSKIFMQLGNAIDSAKEKGKSTNTDLNEVIETEKAPSSFGSTEVMMMLMLLFLSLLCELLINLFSPKTNISSKMLSQFTQYLPHDFDTNDFMMDVLIAQLKDGVMTQEEFDKQAEAVVRKMMITKDELIEKMKSKILSEDHIEKNKLTTKVKKSSKEVLIADNELKEIPKKVIVEEPKEVNIIEEPQHFSSAVDDAVKEIEELLK